MTSVSTCTKALGLMVLVAATAGCDTLLAPSSSGWDNEGFTRVNMAAPDGRTHSGILPDRCYDRREQPSGTMVDLPPGCATDLNLINMAARPDSLIHGEQMGDARAEPLVRAAQQRLSEPKEDQAEDAERQQQKSPTPTQSAGSF
ncbi:hypothetical protein R84981_001231 [Carnimonas sp. R-84981]|uniref:hypothetical protein n=1 Tax=Carnimonas bestiolae TaxID=3402172 RepID=UPI003EDC0AFB